MWVLIDNYDSFSHILHHYLLQLHPDIPVFRNDEVSLEQLIAMKPQRIIISPGPGRPEHSGITNAVVKHFHDKIPLLGICLGHQALGQFFGAVLTKASRPVHGMTTRIFHDGNTLFKDIPSGFRAMRYHSLILEEWEQTDIIPLAFSEDKEELMAFAHPVFPVVGIQFHPESILTAYGMKLLEHWKEMYPDT